MPDISSSTQDTNGINMLQSDKLRYVQYVDITALIFYSPDATFTGYSADGYYYTNGIIDATHSPAIASWSSEGQHTSATATRGLLDRFPDRIFVVTTDEEVAILDADSLDVWMRFIKPAVPTSGSLIGKANTDIRKALFVEGYLIP